MKTASAANQVTTLINRTIYYRIGGLGQQDPAQIDNGVVLSPSDNLVRLPSNICAVISTFIPLVKLIYTINRHKMVE